MKKIICIFLFLFFFSGNSLARTNQGKALVIGNYDYISYPDIEGAKRDVAKVSLMLAGSGYDYETKESYNLGAEAIKYEIEKTFSNSTKSTTNFLYFAGHGKYLTNENMSYLIGVDGKFISVFELESILSKIPGRFFIVLDCCYSGGFIDPEIGTTRSANSVVCTSEELVNSLIQPFISRSRAALLDEKYYVIAAANTTELSWEQNFGSDWGIGGELTRALCLGNGYKGKFLADNSNDGAVSFIELGDFCKNEVKKSHVNTTKNFTEFTVGLVNAFKKSVRYDVAINKEWKIIFNRAIDKESAAEHITVEDFNNVKACSFKFSDDERTVFVSPNEPYINDKYYKLTVGSGLLTKEKDSSLLSNVVMHFYTNIQ